MEIRDLSIAHRKFMLAAKTLEPLNISPTQLIVLNYVNGNTRTMGEIAEYMTFSPAVSTGIAEKLYRIGAIERLPSKDDRRRVYVRITPYGSQLLSSAVDALAGGI